MPYAQKDQEITMLRAELEILMREREALLRVVGAAAGFVANMATASLPPEAYEAAELLAQNLNAVPEETLQDALQAVHASMGAEAPAQGS